MLQRKGKEFISLNAYWTFNIVLCNYRRWTWIASSTTFVKLCNVVPQISISFCWYCHILDWIHYTKGSIICFNKFMFCSKIINKSKDILVKFTFSIYNQQLFFTFVIPYSLRQMMMNFLMKSIWKNIGINSSWNVGIDDTMVVDSIVMITCMSPFSKPLLDFDSMLKFSTFTNMSFDKFYSCIYM